MACLTDSGGGDKENGIRKSAEHYNRLYGFDTDYDEEVHERSQFHMRSRSYDDILSSRTRHHREFLDYDVYASGLTSPRSDVGPLTAFHRRPLLCERCGKLLKLERGLHGMRRRSSVELVLTPPEPPLTRPVNSPRYVTVAFSPEPTCANSFDLWSPEDQEKIEALIKANSRTEKDGRMDDIEDPVSYKKLTLSLPDMTPTKGKRQFKEVSVDIDASPHLLTTANTPPIGSGQEEFPFSVDGRFASKSPVLEEKYLISMDDSNIESAPPSVVDIQADSDKPHKIPPLSLSYEQGNFPEDGSPSDAGNREMYFAERKEEGSFDSIYFVTGVPSTPSSKDDDSFDAEIADLDISGVDALDTEKCCEGSDLTLVSPVNDSGILWDQTFDGESTLKDTSSFNSELTREVTHKSYGLPESVIAKFTFPEDAAVEARVEAVSFEEPPKTSSPTEDRIVDNDDVIEPNEEEPSHRESPQANEESDRMSLPSIPSEEDDSDEEGFMAEWSEEFHRERVMVNVIVDMPDSEESEPDSDSDRKKKNKKRKKSHKERVKVNLIVDLHDPRNVFGDFKSSSEEGEGEKKPGFHEKQPVSNVKVLKPLQTIPLFYQEEEPVVSNLEIARFNEHPPPPTVFPVSTTKVLAISSLKTPVHTTSFFSAEHLAIEKYQTVIERKENDDIVVEGVTETHGLYAAVIRTQEPCVEGDGTKMATVADDSQAHVALVGSGKKQIVEEEWTEEKRIDDVQLPQELGEVENNAAQLPQELGEESGEIEAKGISVVYFNVKPLFEVTKFIGTPESESVLDSESIAITAEPVALLETTDDASTIRTEEDLQLGRHQQQYTEDEGGISVAYFENNQQLLKVGVPLEGDSKPFCASNHQQCPTPMPVDIEEILETSPSTDFFEPSDDDDEVVDETKLESPPITNFYGVSSKELEDLIPDGPSTDFFKPALSALDEEDAVQADSTEADDRDSDEPKIGTIIFNEISEETESESQSDGEVVTIDVIQNDTFIITREISQQFDVDGDAPRDAVTIETSEMRIDLTTSTNEIVATFSTSMEECPADEGEDPGESEEVSENFGFPKITTKVDVLVQPIAVEIDIGSSPTPIKITVPSTEEVPEEMPQQGLLVDPIELVKTADVESLPEDLTVGTLDLPYHDVETGSSTGGEEPSKQEIQEEVQVPAEVKVVEELPEFSNLPVEVAVSNKIQEDVLVPKDEVLIEQAPYFFQPVEIVFSSQIQEEIPVPKDEEVAVLNQIQKDVLVPENEKLIERTPDLILPVEVPLVSQIQEEVLVAKDEGLFEKSPDLIQPVTVSNLIQEEVLAAKDEGLIEQTPEHTDILMPLDEIPGEKIIPEKELISSIIDDGNDATSDDEISTTTMINIAASLGKEEGATEVNSVELQVDEPLSVDVELERQKTKILISKVKTFYPKIGPLIQDLMIEMETGEKRSAKEALLLWCQSKTHGYKNVNITNFTTSWKDGLAFSALIHKHRPDVIDYDKLVKEEPMKNLNMSFDCAEKELGIARLLDAPDLDVDRPDEKSIMTYVATYYQYFSKQKQVEVSGSRIQKVIKHALDNEKLVNEYESLTSNLQKWILEKIEKLEDRTFGNSLLTVQQQMMEFNLYRTQEKPPKFVEKCNLEVQMFEIASQLRLNHQKMYVPKEGLLVNDINKAWQQMEKEEHTREVALREELIRQQQLEELATRFDRKANLREAWLSENCKLLSVDNFGEDLPAVEASVKKHEAIETDIKAYEARIAGVRVLADKLEAENFHRIEWIKSTTDRINDLWQGLLELLDKRSSRLHKHHDLHKIFQEMVYIIDWMDDVKIGLLSEYYGNHFLSVEDLLQKHALVEADITAQAERVTLSNRAAEDFLEKASADDTDGYKPDVETVKTNQSELETSYQELLQLAQKRRQMLEESLRLHTFYRDLEEEDIWLSEKEYFVSSTEYGNDINTTTLLLQQHSTLEQELGAKKTLTNTLLEDSDNLLEEMPYAAEKVNEHVSSIKTKWDIVDHLSAKRRNRLEEVLKLQQYHADCREIEADMNEMEAPISSTDYGHDVNSVNELLKKEKVLEDELAKIEASMDAVENQRANTLGEDDRDSEEVLKAKEDLDKHLGDLKIKLADRHQKLLGALSLFKLYHETDLVTSWIVGRRSQLTTYLKVERTDDMERCKAIQLRFEGFEQELLANQDRMQTVNSLAAELKEKNPEAEDPITEERINNLNSSWDDLKEEAEERKKELVACLLIQNLYCEMTETRTWMVEKSRLLASVEDPGVDLSSVITLQRRLNSIERDIAALPSKMQDLHAQAVELSREYPEEAVNIQTRFDSLQQCWDNLSKMVKKKNESLAETGELKRFIMSLDDFLNFLTQTSEQCASEELPQSLSEAESLLDAHFDLQTVVEQHSDDYNTLMEEGPKYVREDQNDLQTQSLRQQMLDVKDGWQQLHVLWDTRKEQLEQSMNYQLFLRDAKQCEAALGQQELYLSRQVETPTADSVQEEIKKLEEFIKKMDTHDEKINHVIQFADQLQGNGHYARDKVTEKAAYINEHRNTNRENANDQLAKLRDYLRLMQFLEDSNEVIDWMNERMHSATDESYKDDTSNMRSKLLKHQAFEAELNANKIKIDALKKAGAEIIEDKEETRPKVEKQLEQIDELWDILNKTCAEKKAHLSEVNRQQQFGNEVTNLDKWVTEIHTQLNDKEIGTDVTTARALYNKHKKTEKAIETKKQRMIELCANPEEVDEDKLVAEQQIMEERFCALEEPLQEKGVLLDESLKFFQFKRDVEDAQLWIEEKEPILKSDNLGDSLHDVQRLKKRHANLCTEVDGHEPLINALRIRGEEMINENHPDAEDVQQLCNDLQTKWDSLKDLSQDFQGKLDVGLQAKKYYFDAAEAESWMSEQELFLLGEERGKDEEHVQKLLKKHQAIENAINDYEDTIKELDNEAQKMIDEGHVESEPIQQTQSKIEDLYSQLKDLANEKQAKLDENLKLFQFNREVEDLKSWIADREVIAGSEDIGQDFDNVQMIEERFDRFADETRNIGQERVSTVNAMCDQLIGGGHQDAALISEWKEDLNDTWKGLLELLNTRSEVLTKAHEMHRYFQEAKQTMLMILEKDNNLTEDLGRDQQSVYALQRLHKAFEADLQPLGLKVESIQEFATELKGQYAGEKLIEILQREDEVLDAWKALLQRVTARSAKLGQSDEYQRLIIMIQNLLLWIQDMRLQIESDEQPRDIAHCEDLMGTHQGRKSEIDAKADKFKSVEETANELMEKDHYASIEIKERIDNLMQERNILDEEWDLHWEELQMNLDVMQFARDAHLADEWIAQNEHIVQGKDASKSLGEITKLIEKHNNFERLLTKQEDRFNTLERLTTFELRNARQKQLDAAKKEREEKDKLEREIGEQRERELELKRVEEEKEKERLRAVSASPPAQQQVEQQQSQSPQNARVNGEEKPTESDLVIGVDGVKMFGQLSRKPTKEAGNKKAHSRVWKNFFTVLKETDLLFFLNEKEAKNKANPTHVISTTGGVATIAGDYTKKKNVLRLVLASGAEYLMHTESVNEMTTWIQSIGAVTTRQADGIDGEEEIQKRLSTMGSPSRPTSTIENNSISATPDESSKKEKKRKSLFGNKKKSQKDKSGSDLGAKVDS